MWSKLWSAKTHARKRSKNFSEIMVADAVGVEPVSMRTFPDIRENTGIFAEVCSVEVFGTPD